jgi:imidazole glycerol-phosphate synthase subunit HisF
LKKENFLIMSNVRLIARLDVKGKNLIKGVHLEGLRVMGDPQEHALRYYHHGADEIIYMDTVASLYGRNNLSNIVEMTAKNVFIPITVGGGIRSVLDAKRMLSSGADKVAINTAAIHNPTLISDMAEALGCQAVVVSIEAVSRGDREWEAMTDNAREKTGKSVVEWAIEAVRLGAGEILLTSVAQEGTGKGLDLDLINAVSERVDVPVIASGGVGSVDHIVQGVYAGADAIAIADLLHYKKMTMNEVNETARQHKLSIRQVSKHGY